MHNANAQIRHATWLLIALALVIYLVGVALLLAEAGFLEYVREDGPAEWLTALMLFAAAGYALAVRSVQRDPAMRVRRLIWLGLAVVCLFAALEEISYGQRLLGFETPRFFLRAGAADSFYNRQQEMNLHNLVIYGVNLNKVVFGKLLAVASVLWLLVMPVIYVRSARLAALVDRAAIPLARNFPIFITVVVNVVTALLTPREGQEKVAELRELICCTVLLVTLLDPRNPIARPSWLDRVMHRLSALGRAAPRARLIVAVSGLQLILGGALRIAFLLAFRSTAGEMNGGDVLRALYIGMKLDLRLALLIALPFLLLSLFPALNPAHRGRARTIWCGYFVAVETAILFLYFVDFGHYGYLHRRLDAGLLDHVLSVRIALEIAWETYPVIPGLLALGGLATAYAVLLRRLGFSARPALGFARRVHRTLAASGLVALYVFGIYGKCSWYPLRWSDAFFSPNEFVSALAVNPVLFLFDTIPDRGRPYDLEKVRASYEVVADLLEVDSPDPATLSLARRTAAAQRMPFRPNLVLIHLESLAGYQTGVLGNRLDPSPELDRIAAESILFTHFFVPTTPTARSVFTMLTGIPDVNPVRSASRNPRVVNQATLVNALDGYRKLYFLGGSATWANIRGLLAHNIPGLEIHEEGDYDAPRVDGWGVSDLDLFEEAHEVLRNETEPFFVFVQTAGNHEPHTIPEDRRGFEIVEVDEETLRDNGFKSQSAYNGFRLLDHSLGHFFRLAREAPYYEQTLFVLYGDHGYPAPRATAWEQLSLTIHHVPLVIFAPWEIDRARRVDSVASLVDVLPTALSLMGIPYTNTTLGRNLLAPRSSRLHAAFIRNGLLTDDYMLRVDRQGGERLYAYRSPGATEDLRQRFPDEAARLRRTYDAILETSRYLTYHNTPPDSGLRVSVR